MKPTMRRKRKPEYSKTRFKDVIGAEEAKKEMASIVSYLRSPKKFTRLGGKVPKGVLLIGPPGNGKTLLAKAVAGESGVPFLYSSGSEFEEMYIGLGAKRVRELFQRARENSPAIIFIDEIDAVGSRRNGKDQAAMRMTLNQLLVEMDGFSESAGVIVIAATNFPELLDPALVRPGRFDRKVVVPLPDLKAREGIIELYMSKIKMATTKKMTERIIQKLARGTSGLTAADLDNIVNTAAVHASVEGKRGVEEEDLEFAKDKVILGGEASTRVVPEQVKVYTAWHEAGHALVAHFTEGALPLYKATVVPRGPALGMVMQLPEEKHLMQSTKAELLAKIDVCMGGRAAEELKFGKENVTTGASSDLQQATRIAEMMVKQSGMSDEVGLTFVEGKNNQVIEKEVKRILDESYERVKKLLDNKTVQLQSLAESLLLYETLDADEIQLLLDGGNLKGLEKHRIDQMKAEAPVPKELY